MQGKLPASISGIFVTDIIKEHVPLFEKSSIDGILRRSNRNGPVFMACHQIFLPSYAIKLLRKPDFHFLWSIGEIRLVFQVATKIEASPIMNKDRFRGYEKLFLAPLSI